MTSHVEGRNEHATPDARQFTVDEVLRDGGSIHIRAIRPDDKQRLLEHFRRLGPMSVKLRFCGAKKELTDEELRWFTEPDFVGHVGLVATLRERGAERIIGVGRYIAIPESDTPPKRAEVAFAVADEHQGRGIGTLLLEHLVPIARNNGITAFEAEVLGENNRMLEVFAAAGFVVRSSIRAGMIHVSFPTEETPQSIEASHHRERLAAARSVRAFLEPRSVALVGASRQPGSIGATLLANLTNGFTGAIHPVNPRVAEFEGLRAHPSVTAIGQPVDLAVIAVPAASVEEVVADCARAGVHGVVVISSGFGEVSAAGRAAERRLRDLVRASGMRMVGPNCMGVLNTDPALRLNATFAPAAPPAGNIAMLSQSGALGIAVLEHARDRGLGLSSFVSVGNKADVSGNDLLAYWAEDSRTQVVLLYLESFGNPRKFARVAPEVARHKPIVAVKAGRSAAGTRAASSHSAALASLDVAVDALFEQAGVIRTDTLEGLFDVAALLSTQPVPPGPRVGVVTNAGGPGILLADACEAQGLVLPGLADATLARLRGCLPAQASLVNPVDLIASASPEQYALAIEAVGSDPNVDALVVIHIPRLAAERESMQEAIARGAASIPPGKPVLMVSLTPDAPHAALGGAARGRLPCYAFPENAARALAAAERYGRWRSRPAGSLHKLDRFARDAIRAVIDRVLAGADEPRWLEPADLATVLRAAGIPFVSGDVVQPKEAIAAARALGFPLVAKVVSRDVVHKSDLGGVVLGLQTPDAVAEAVSSLVERTRERGARLDGILLQREVPGGIEALVGVTTDPTFGPLLVCGLGGVLVEVLRDAAFRLTPVSDLDADDMITGLRSARLLDGYRGAPAGDKAALASVIQKVSALVEIIPELRELDLNPVKVLAPGEGAVVVDGRMRVGPLETGPC